MGLANDAVKVEDTILLDNSWSRVKAPTDNKTCCLIFWEKMTDFDQPSQDKVVSTLKFIALIHTSRHTDLHPVWFPHL